VETHIQEEARQRNELEDKAGIAERKGQVTFIIFRKFINLNKEIIKMIRSRLFTQEYIQLVPISQRLRTNNISELISSNSVYAEKHAIKYRIVYFEAFLIV
jgi:hypothetical protein